jgi:O-antigen/teichoic acid export membrane protein
MTTMMAEVARASLYGLQRMTTTAATDIVTRFIEVTMVIGVLLAGRGTATVAAVAVVPAAVSLLVLWRHLLTRTASRRWNEAPTAAAVLRRGSPFLLASAVMTVYASLNVVLISLVATSEEIGWYAASATLVGTLLFIPTTTMTSLFPLVAQVHQENPDAIGDLLAKGMRSLWLVAVPLSVGTIVVSESLVTTIFGEEFKSAAPVLAVASVVLFLLFQTIPLGHVAFATERTRLFNGVMVAATMLMVPIGLVLVRWTRDRFENGAIGGALTQVATELLILVVLGWEFAPRLFNRVTLVRALKCGVAAAVMVACTWPLRREFPAVIVVVGALSYVAAAVLLRIPDDHEREQAHRAWVTTKRTLRRLGSRLPALPVR